MMSIKPTKEQVIEHLREGVHDNCLVCDQRFVGSWTDLNGEMNCSNCGMTIQVISFKGNEETLLADLGLTKAEVARKHCPDFERVPIYRAYWQETHNRLPLGHFFGETPQWKRDANYPYVKWLWAHRDVYQVEYAVDYLWDVVQQIAERVTAEL